jgi:hypothetical protein
MLYLQYGSLELTGVILAYLGKLENPSIIYRLLAFSARGCEKMRHSIRMCGELSPSFRTIEKAYIFLYDIFC